MNDWTISSENDMVMVFESLAYAFGLFLGNGHARCYPGTGNGGWYITESCSMDKEVAEKWREQVNTVFKASYPLLTRTLKSGIPFYTVRASKKVVFAVFTSFTDFRQDFPSELWKASLDVKRYFVAGLMDSDGTVKVTKLPSGLPRWQLGFSNTKLALTEGLASLLFQLGVKVGVISKYTKQGYLEMHSIYPNIRSFYDAGLFFVSKRKQQRLLDYVNRVVGSETMYSASDTLDDDIVQPNYESVG